MTALEWSDELSVGVEEIDNQHKEIIRRTAELVDAFGRNKQGEQLEHLMAFMSDYVRDHFRLEEKHMALYNYPEIEDHRAEHDRIAAQVEKLKEKLGRPQSAETIPVIEELFVLMGRLLLDHMHQTDKRMARFLITVTRGAEI